MTIDYFEPLRRAWARMVRILFRPFDLMLWLGLGFSSFLAELGREGGSGSGGRHKVGARDGDFSGALDDVAQRIHDFLHLGWVQAAFGVLVVAAIVVSILFVWLRARGGMVFLNGVMHGRGDVIEPWRRTSKAGNTLFLLDLGVSTGFFLLAVLLLSGPLTPTWNGIWNDGVFRMPDWGGLVAPLLVVAIAALLMGLYHVLKCLFVMPLMLLHSCSVFEGWSRFGRVLSGNVGHFVAALLLWIVVSVAVGFVVAVAMFSTCCIGFVLIAIPYVGNVLLLPVHVFLRGFGPEFLAQFGPEYDARVLVPAGEAGPQAPPVA